MRIIDAIWSKVNPMEKEINKRHKKEIDKLTRKLEKQKLQFELNEYKINDGSALGETKYNPNQKGLNMIFGE